MSPRKKISRLWIFFFLILLPCPGFAAENPSLTSELPKAGEVAKYENLLKAIRNVRHASQARIEQAARQEKVREAWETGKLIDEHILQHKERAEYGEQVLKKLAVDLGTSHTELKYMLQFARTYPMGLPADPLSWSHYQSLLALNDPEERKEVAERAIKNKWNRNQIREEVRKRKAQRAQKDNPPQETRLEPLPPGKPGTYQVVVAVDGPYKKELALDLGFSNYYRPQKMDGFKPGEMVELEGKRLKKIASSDLSLAARANLLHTYPAYVRHIVDGDTFYAVIDLGFGFTTVQKLRLRGLDAPELVTAEGQEAKTFLEKMLKDESRSTSLEKNQNSLRLGTRGSLPAVLIRTVKSDKYDRYLADVFINGEYVNQKLLEEGYATVMND